MVLSEQLQLPSQHTSWIWVISRAFWRCLQVLWVWWLSFIFNPHGRSLWSTSGPLVVNWYNKKKGNEIHMSLSSKLQHTKWSLWFTNGPLVAYWHNEKKGSEIHMNLSSKHQHTKPFISSKNPGVVISIFIWTRSCHRLTEGNAVCRATEIVHRYRVVTRILYAGRYSSHPYSCVGCWAERTRKHSVGGKPSALRP